MRPTLPLYYVSLFFFFFLKRQLDWVGKSRTRAASLCRKHQHKPCCCATPLPGLLVAEDVFASFPPPLEKTIHTPQVQAVLLACKRTLLLSSFITLLLASCLSFWFTSLLSDFLIWWQFLFQHWNSHLHVPSGFCTLFSLLKIPYPLGLS